jgi:hypothetical protein
LPLAQVTRNALDVLSIAGVVGVDVVQGQARPLLRPSPLLCPEIHGESGLDGWVAAGKWDLICEKPAGIWDLICEKPAGIWDLIFEKPAGGAMACVGGRKRSQEGCGKGRGLLRFPAVM